MNRKGASEKKNIVKTGPRVLRDDGAASGFSLSPCRSLFGGPFSLSRLQGAAAAAAVVDAQTENTPLGLPPPAPGAARRLGRRRRDSHHRGCTTTTTPPPQPPPSTSTRLTRRRRQLRARLLLSVFARDR